MPMRDKRYTGSVWRRVRREILARDSEQCQIRLANCEGVATQVDHIIPSADGGAFYDPDNLRAACSACNATRASKQKASDGWRRSPTEIVLVMGPPCAGKSTFVRDHAASDELVIDYDVIAVALGSPDHHSHPDSFRPAVVRARGAVLTMVRRGELPKVRRVWIVSSDPFAAKKYMHHRVELLDPGIDVVLERAARERPGVWADLIRRWYEVISASAAGSASRTW